MKQLPIQELFSFKTEIEGRPYLVTIPMLPILKKWVKAYSRIDQNTADQHKQYALSFEEYLHNYSVCEFYHMPVCYVDGLLSNPLFTEIDDDDRDYGLYLQLIPLDGGKLPEEEISAELQGIPPELVKFQKRKTVRWRTENGAAISIDPVFTGRPGPMLRSLAVKPLL